MADERPTVIHVHVETWADLTVEEVWPDGDAPEVITAEAVRDYMESQGDAAYVLGDWGLLYDLSAFVSVGRPNPAWAQDENLLGEPPQPRWLNEHIEVWAPRRPS